MTTILASAGFTVEDASDEFRPISYGGGGICPGRPPMWSLRDDEMAMPGWKPTSRGESAS
jgi:hypothetical protein